MGMIDYQNEMSDAVAVTATALSDVIDLNSYPAYAAGEDLFVKATVNTAFAGGTSIQAILWTDDTATVTSGAKIVTAPAVLTAAAVAGKTLLQVDLQGLDLQQYIGVQYVIVGTMSAGKVDTRLEITPDKDEVTLS